MQKPDLVAATLKNVIDPATGNMMLVFASQRGEKQTVGLTPEQQNLLFLLLLAKPSHMGSLDSPLRLFGVKPFVHPKGYGMLLMFGGSNELAVTFPKEFLPMLKQAVDRYENPEPNTRPH